jgi:hypothetical protein
MLVRIGSDGYCGLNVLRGGMILTFEALQIFGKIPALPHELPGLDPARVRYPALEERYRLLYAVV